MTGSELDERRTIDGFGRNDVELSTRLAENRQRRPLLRGVGSQISVTDKSAGTIPSPAFIAASRPDENPACIRNHTEWIESIRRRTDKPKAASKEHGSNSIATMLVNGEILSNCSKNAKK
ncbi:hypothetical protein [Ensifer canadensis]